MLIVVVAAGCEPSTIALPLAATPDPLPPLGTHFDRAESAKYSGRIHWCIPDHFPAHWTYPPNIPPVRRSLGNNRHDEIPNPNALTREPDRGIVGAVVALRGIDPAKSKPWHHPPVEVELTDRGIIVHQGDHHGRDGFVRRGDTVVFRVSGEQTLGFRARGAECFGSILTPKQSQVTHRFNKPGRVSLTSASGQYWSSADLFICDTPYITRTGADEEYVLSDIPPGPCEYAVYIPNWNVESCEIDPETGVLVRQQYAAPFEYVDPIVIKARVHTGRDHTMNMPLLVIP